MALARVNVSSGGRTPPITVNVPTQSGTLTYSGSVKMPTWNGYDATQLLIGGTTSATDAGTYTATFTPQGNVTWSDGTSSPKSVTWTIAKATPTLTLSKTSGQVNKDETVTFTATSPSDGALSVTSSNSNVATATVSGTTITVTGRGSGDATITVSQAATTNYTAKTATYTVAIIAPAIITDDWATISSRAKAGTAANYYKVGDIKKVTLNGKIGSSFELNNEELYVFILHINYPMNGTPDNNIIWGGFQSAAGKDLVLDISTLRASSMQGKYWDTDPLRINILGSVGTDISPDATAETLTNPKADTLLAALPADFRGALRLWNRYFVSTASTTPAIEKTVDAVSLLFDTELLGDNYDMSTVGLRCQTQLDYYKQFGGVLRYFSDDDTKARWWFILREKLENADVTPKTYPATFDCKVISGAMQLTNTGIAPAFKV